jgi:tryptophanase
MAGDEIHPEYLKQGCLSMENFKHLPEPFRIRVIEPVKRTTRAYREAAQ